MEALGAHFVAHITLGDSHTVMPGTRVTKVWRVRNAGSLAWPAGTRLVNVGGELMSGPPMGVEVPSIPCGHEVEISISLVAPAICARHVGYWRLVTPNGTRFGHRLWVDLWVENSNAQAVMATLAAQSAPAEEAVAAPEAARSDSDAGLEEWEHVAAPGAEETTSASAAPEAAESAAAASTPAAPEAEESTSAASVAPAPAAGEDVSYPAIMPPMPETPATPPTAPAATLELDPVLADRWATQLSQIADMGFSGIPRAAQLLQKHAGNLQSAIADLVAEQAQA
jgi:next-to-BRCA1 protein 1